MARVADLLQRKSAALHTIGPDASVHDAIDAMVRHRIGSLVVMDGDTLVGIFTERDVLTRVALSGLPTRMTAVRQVMTRDVLTVDAQITVEECMERMTQHRIRHLPVMEGRTVKGMVSIGDMVRNCLAEREVEVRHLTEYIAGQYS